MKRVSCDFPLSLNTGRGYMGWVLRRSPLLKQTLPAASGWRTRPHQPWRRTDRRYQSPASEPQGRLSRRSANTHSHAAHVWYSALGPFVYIYGRVRKAGVILLWVLSHLCCRSETCYLGWAAYDDRTDPDRVQGLKNNQNPNMLSRRWHVSVV